MPARMIALVNAFMIMAAALVAPSYGQTPTVDPKSLLGEWEGTIRGPANIDYFPFLTKVEGNQITGKARNVGQRTTEYEIVGTVQGNVFKYRSTSHPLSVELVIDGDTMRGTGERADAGAVGQFFVRKRK